MKDREKKWQKKWGESSIFGDAEKSGDKRYVLAMFPYPSGNLHMGHVRNYTLADAYARYSRQKGYSVLHPMGWDSFGLPAENAAIERDTHPKEWIDECISDMKEELQDLGFSYNWKREFRTSNSDVYKWTQWIFIQLFTNDLVERKEAYLNWCDDCETVLADAQVEGEEDLCWRCDTKIEQVSREQWFLKTTEYSEELVEYLDKLEDWPKEVVEQQKNWIEGSPDSSKYNLQDWLISRQRYWGTPIPLIHCENCGYVTESEENLPVELPSNFSSNGGNPLDRSEDFKSTTCPDCGRDSKRVTDTMDTFVDSSWYFMQFASKNQGSNPIKSDESDYWLPVDEYVGGVEHATTHLLYARFIMHALNDMGYTEVSEPFESLTTQGMVLLDDEKMSKSKGNVVEPDKIINEYGTDTARWFICDAAAPQYDFNWNDDKVKSTDEFVNSLVSNFDQNLESEGNGNIDNFVRSYCSLLLQECEKHYNNLDYHLVTTEIREFESKIRRYYGSQYTSKSVDRLIRQTIAIVSYPIIPHCSEELTEEFTRTYEWHIPEKDLNVEYTESVESDIISILNTIEYEDISRIEICCGDEWMYDLHSMIMEDDVNSVSDMMEYDKFRQKGDEAVDAYGRLRDIEFCFESREKETRNLKSLSTHLENKYGCEVEIIQDQNRGISGRPDINIVPEN